MFYLEQLVALLVATVTGAPVGIVSATFNLAFSIFTGIVRKLLEQQGIKRKNNKIVMLARSKLDSTESKISEALINIEISHEEFMIIINEEKKYGELKESIRMMKSKKWYWKINPIEEGKKIGIDEVIKHNEIINKSLKSQI